MSIPKTPIALLTIAAGGVNATCTTSPPPTKVPMDRCAVIRASIDKAGFGPRVGVTCDDDYAYVQSDTHPDHELMTGIVGTNEQVPVPAVDYTSPIPLAPTRAAEPTMRDAALGVAVNGVPMYDYSAAGELTREDLSTYHPQIDTIALGQLDNCGGHAGRGDDYHYHATPTCMLEQMADAGDDAVIGWAFDGYPIYGNKNPDGTTLQDDALGPCNEQDDDLFGLRYHTTPDWPYTLQCLVGEVSDGPDALPRVPPLRDAQGQERPPGMPPPGGVQDLVLAPEGEARVMRYRYDGEDYYISYAPSGAANCYVFEMRTVTNGGVVETGEYCR